MENNLTGELICGSFFGRLFTFAADEYRTKYLDGLQVKKHTVVKTGESVGEYYKAEWGDMPHLSALDENKTTFKESRIKKLNTYGFV